MPTRSLGFQSFYQAQLTAAISATDLTIPLDVLPTPSEGILVIESTVAGKREIIYYTSKTSSAVVCPAGTGNGRGYDGTTAVSHLQNSAVIMAPVAQMFKSLQDGTSMSSTVTFDNVVANTLSVGGQTPTADWSQLASAPNTVTANGNRSYSLVFNGVDYTSTMQPGTRVRTTRTVTAPTQCTSLNGTNQYYSKSSPAGMTFTDDFVVSAWVKLNAYGNANNDIVSRFNGTSGWRLTITSDGRVVLVGYNASSVNFSEVRSYQSVPLNKWVHIAAQLDMSAYTATTTTSYIMFDGVDVPAVVNRGGTNPTALVQAGNLEVGSFNAGNGYFPGKLAQVAIYSAKVTQANVVATISQGLLGTETSLISGFSLSNSVNDLNTTNANNLTAQNSATTTNADSPFAQDGRGVPGGTYDYGIIQSISFSTNTTAVVQVPEGNTIPTSGGVSALYYSSSNAPFGSPNGNRFQISVPSDSIEKTLVQTGVYSPISGCRLTNSGTAGGTMFYSNYGGKRELNAQSATLSIGTAATIFTFIIPSGMFNRVYNGQTCAQPVSASAKQLTNFASTSTTLLEAYLWSDTAGSTSRINATVSGD